MKRTRKIYKARKNEFTANKQSVDILNKMSNTKPISDKELKEWVKKEKKKK